MPLSLPGSFTDTELPISIRNDRKKKEIPVKAHVTHEHLRSEFGLCVLIFHKIMSLQNDPKWQSGSHDVSPTLLVSLSDERAQPLR